MKKFHVYSIITGIALLFFLIWKIGPRELWRDLTLLGWGLLPMILLEGLVDLFNTIGWRYCLSGPHRSLPFFQIFCIRLAGTSINYLTPTATLGGEIIKGSLLSLNHQGPQAAAGVIIGKLSYTLAQLIFVVLGSFFVLWKIELPVGVWVAMLAGSTLLGAGLLGFLAVQKYGKLGAIVRWLMVHKVGGKALEKVEHHITKVDNELKIFYKKHPQNLTLSMFWHTIGMACSIMKCWYFLFIMIDHASFLMAVGIWFLGSWIDLVGFAIPSKIGLLEGTLVIIFRLFGLQSALGFTYGIALRLEQIFWAGVGLLIYTALLGKKRERKLFPSKRAKGDTPWHTH